MTSLNWALSIRFLENEVKFQKMSSRMEFDVFGVLLPSQGRKGGTHLPCLKGEVAPRTRGRTSTLRLGLGTSGWIQADKPTPAPHPDSRLTLSFSPQFVLICSSSLGTLNWCASFFLLPYPLCFVPYFLVWCLLQALGWVTDLSHSARIPSVRCPWRLRVQETSASSWVSLKTSLS